MARTPFLWGFGIEDTFIGDPYEKTGKILDEYELTDHYRLWKTDFDNAAAIGLDAVRWGIPWYKVQPERGKWDWSFPDQVIPYIVKEKGIKLVLDLMHYGVPTWMDKAYLDPDYPAYVEEYTHRAIERYGQYLEYATPYNEPHTACEFCGRQGVWPPYLSGLEGYFDVLKGVVLGTQRQTKLLQKAGITCVQVECSGGSFAKNPNLEQQAELERLQQYLFFHCLTGDYAGLEKHLPTLAQYGLTDKDLTGFQKNSCTIDVMGINFYPQFSYQDIEKGPDGRIVRSNHPLWVDDLRAKIHERYARWNCPMMITESSVRDDLEMKKRWLREAAPAVYALYQQGIPVNGFFWFPIIDMYDWEYRTNDGAKENFEAKFGLFDYARQPNECADMYKQIVRECR